MCYALLLTLRKFSITPYARAGMHGIERISWMVLLFLFPCSSINVPRSSDTQWMNTKQYNKIPAHKWKSNLRNTMTMQNVPSLRSSFWILKHFNNNEFRTMSDIDIPWWNLQISANNYSKKYQQQIRLSSTTYFLSYLEAFCLVEASAHIHCPTMWTK